MSLRPRKSSSPGTLMNSSLPFNDAALPLVHYFTFFHSLGGVQSFLKRHEMFDGDRGIKSEFVLFFEKEQSLRRTGVGLGPLSTIAGARQKFSSKGMRLGSIGVYHNFWGTGIFADLDGLQRR